MFDNDFSRTQEVLDSTKHTLNKNVNAANEVMDELRNRVQAPAKKAQEAIDFVECKLDGLYDSVMNANLGINRLGEGGVSKEGIQWPEFGHQSVDETREDGSTNKESETSLPFGYIHEIDQKNADGSSRYEYHEHHPDYAWDETEQKNADGSSDWQYDSHMMFGAGKQGKHHTQNADGTFDNQGELQMFGFGTAYHDGKNNERSFSSKKYYAPFGSVQHREIRRDDSDTTHTYIEENGVLGFKVRSEEKLNPDGSRDDEQTFSAPFGLFTDTRKKHRTAEQVREDEETENSAVYA